MEELKKINVQKLKGGRNKKEDKDLGHMIPKAQKQKLSKTLFRIGWFGRIVSTYYN